MSEQWTEDDKGRILIVDDTYANLKLLMNLLREHDYTVHLAPGGEVALRFIESMLPDLILLDIVMPGLDGYQVCELLKASERTRHIPVIFMTALTDTQDKVAGFAAGGVDYITKPFRPEEVLARVQTHMAMHTLHKQLAAQNVRLQQEIAEREQAEAALREAHAGLEQRVVERTAELSQANTILHQQIIERARAEAALAAERNLLRTLIDNLPDYIYFKDTQSRFVSGNIAVAHVMGATTPDELIGKTDFDFHPPDLAAQYYADEQAIIGSGQPLLNREEPLLNRRTGKKTWQSTTKVPLRDSAGKVMGLVGISRDITERKQAEEELQHHRDHLEKLVVARTAELRGANAELTQYAYVVSHDLEAPLRAIHNYASFLHEDLAPTLTGEQRLYLDGLVRAVREAGELVRDLLQLSRIGHHSAPTEAIDLGEFLRTLVAALDLSADVEIDWDAEWPTIESEPMLLRQIFQNLILNAIKFNHSTPKRIELGCRLAEPDRYELFVRDNGIGIAAHHQEQIFQVFRRLHTQAEYAGTGIGLAIVEKAAGKLQGTVRVESQPGAGSTFFVSLPRTLSAVYTEPN